jgi:hypothetical protein
LNHGLADAVALQRRCYSDVLDDRRGRAEVAEVMHHQQGKGSHDIAATLGDVERVVGIIGEALEQLLRGRKREHVARVEFGLRVKIENFRQIRFRRRPH